MNTSSIKFIFLLTILFFYFPINSFSQKTIDNIELANINVEAITNRQIKQIKDEMLKQNISIDELEKLAKVKGMKDSDFILLKSKIENYKESPDGNIDDNNKNIINESAIKSDLEVGNLPKENKSVIFGAELFTNPSLSFEPNSNMAAPVNYVLGGGDELSIVIYGIQEFIATSPVSRDGDIYIPNIGKLKVNGLTLEAASVLIKNSCAKIFKSIRSGQSDISVTLTNIRTIKVTITGAKKSGNYSLSSFSTVYNALYLAGGPSENGSYRTIELIRGNKIIKKIDIYKYLTSGDQSDNINLKDNDIIRIPTYNNRVEISGEVKKPGIFELLEGETFDQLLKYCSGFTENALLSSIHLVQNTEKELKIIDLKKEAFSTYIIQPGDRYQVSKILQRYENRISVDGSVYRPSNFALEEGDKISTLINKADGLTNDAYIYRAQLIRFNNDFTKEIINVDLTKILQGDSTSDIQLKQEDHLHVFSLNEFNDVLKVRIDGQVRKPDYYVYYENLTLFDLITQAGGLTIDASKRIEISRVIKKDEIIKDQKDIATIITIEIEDLLKDISKNIILEPYDVIQVRRKPIYETQKTMSIVGLVEFPGQYTIANKEERIYDLLIRCGGLKTDANPAGIFIKRGEYTIPIDYLKVMKNPKSQANIRAQPGDVLTVLKYVGAIKINGSIVLNTEIPYLKGKHLKYYINSAGGLDDKGWRNKIYCTYPNGTSKSTSHFLFIRNYPKILPGSVITIPKKPEKKEHTAGSFVAVASVSTSMATMIAVLAKLFQ